MSTRALGGDQAALALATDPAERDALTRRLAEVCADTTVSYAQVPQ